MVISLIACLDKNGGIGYRNRLLFHIKKDMEHFRLLTIGHTVIMGRKTFESLPGGALPHRRNIVITRQDIHPAGCEVCHSVEEALQRGKAEEEVFIIGGSSIYAETIDKADRLYLTIVDEAAPEVDAVFPPIDSTKWHVLQKEKHPGFSFWLLVDAGNFSTPLSPSYEEGVLTPYPSPTPLP